MVQGLSLKHDAAGVLSMANSGKNTNTSRKLKDAVGKLLLCCSRSNFFITDLFLPLAQNFLSPLLRPHNAMVCGDVELLLCLCCFAVKSITSPVTLVCPDRLKLRIISVNHVLQENTAYSGA